METVRRSVIGARGGFFVVKGSQADLLSVDKYIRAPFTSIFTKTDAHVFRRAVRVSTSVFHLLGLRGLSQIKPSVVLPISILMVDFVRRLAPGHKRPDDAMRSHRLSVNAAGEITGRCDLNKGRRSRIASIPSLAALLGTPFIVIRKVVNGPMLPSQKSCLGVIRQGFAKGKDWCFHGYSKTAKACPMQEFINPLWIKGTDP